MCESGVAPGAGYAVVKKTVRSFEGFQAFACPSYRCWRKTGNTCAGDRGLFFTAEPTQQATRASHSYWFPWPPKFLGVVQNSRGGCCAHSGSASWLRSSKLRKPLSLEGAASKFDHCPQGRRHLHCKHYLYSPRLCALQTSSERGCSAFALKMVQMRETHEE